MLKKLLIAATVIVSTLIGAQGQSLAATTATPRPSASAQVSSLQQAAATRDLSRIKDGPDLSAPQVVALGRRLAAAATSMADRRAQVADGLVQPDASVGLGWYVYLRFSPQDQRFILGAGTLAVTALICAISAGTACILAGAVAGTVALYVSIYYNPRCWIELRFSYSGTLSRINRSWRC